MLLQQYSIVQSNCLVLVITFLHLTSFRLPNPGAAMYSGVQHAKLVSTIDCKVTLPENGGKNNILSVRNKLLGA